MMWQRNFIAVRVYLIRFNVKLNEVSSTETCRDSNIGCVAAGSHENSTETRVIVPCVKVDPPAVKKNLVPGAKISGTAKRLTDIPDMAGDIACWNIHAASKCDGEVLEIAADASSLDEDIGGGFGRSCGVVVKGDLIMHPIADSYRAFPSGLGGSELAPNWLWAIAPNWSTSQYRLGKRNRKTSEGRSSIGICSAPGYWTSGNDSASMMFQPESLRCPGGARKRAQRLPKESI
jgi:hypothetical protein